MNQIVLGTLFALILFIGILLMLKLGRYIRLRKVGGEISESSGLSAIEGALFGLMGLILAFSFSGAGSRLDARRQLIVDEANCIGTAYLRLELLLPQAKQDLQEKFRQYVDARISVYRTLPDAVKAKAEVARALAIQGEIWSEAVTACQQTNASQTSILLLNSLNAMFDIANTRYMATLIHQPRLVYWLMFILVLICSLLAGFSMGESKAQNWIYIHSFALMLAITVYTIIDLDHPRLGFSQVKNFDQAIVDVRNSMDAGSK
jgi:hypothetical protein